jgi:hypothetical protein
MIKALVSDFSGVLLSPADANYTGLLNDLYKELSARGEYDFWAYFRVNDDLLAFYKSICERINMYMFTREYLQEHPALQTKWKGVFTYI